MSLKNIGMSALAFAFVLAAPDALRAEAAPASGPCPATLPIGVWTIVANGHQGTLNIPVGGIDAAGNLTGTMTLVADGVDAIRGFWTPSSCRITFVRTDGLNPLVVANSAFVQT